jgi:hypothetical protein
MTGGLMSEKTREAIILDQHPGLRDHITELPEFIAWRDTLPVVEIDAEIFYVVGGDQLRDHDQISVAWVNQHRPQLLKDRRWVK